MTDEFAILVVATEHDAHIELTGFYYDGENEEPTDETTCFTGTVKWDGCANWDNFHTCHGGELVAISMAMVKSYELAIKHYKDQHGSSNVN